MHLNLVPANKLVKNYGVKSLLYSGPGMGKTPIAALAPNPVLCLSEAGAASLSRSTIPVWEAFTWKAIEEFHRWAFESTEVKKYDTLIYDSGSQMAEISLREESAKTSNLQRAYGEMGKKISKIFNELNNMRYKHVIVLAKEGQHRANKSLAVPYFPGEFLNIDLPHLLDEILHIEFNQFNGVDYKTIRTANTPEVRARDRWCCLDAIEQADMSHIINKIMYMRGQNN